MSIRYGMTESSLGAVLIAAEQDGICDIILGDSREALEAAYAARHPDAVPGSDAELAEWLEAVAHGVEHPGEFPSLPLVFHGTEFQRKVWQALQDIPPGETRSYAELGALLGMKDGARAIAGACAANRLAIAIPCHRVVRSDGELSGYRWGLERKALLLERERESQVSR